jgi:NADPH-dependent ferric siderophore reductase
VSLVAEVANEADELKFGTAADLAVTWRHHNGEGPGMAAAQAVRDLGLPAGRGAVWVGLEAGAMRAVRRHLIGVRGLDREQLYTRGYWKLGVSDHPDHDTGED